MKKKMVFINQSAGYLMVDVVNEFVPLYDECVLITGNLNPRNKPLDERVKVRKIIAYDRRSTWRRIFTWGWSTIQITLQLLLRYRKAELFIVSNPPFAPLLPVFVTNRFSLLIYDVYPDALIEYNFIGERSLLARSWQSLNRKVFARADRIFTLTESMKQRLLRYTEQDQKLQVVPVWTDNTFFQPIAKHENNFVKKHQLEDRFIVLYSGNIGHTHPVEILVELARLCTRPEVFFLIVGEGEKAQLIRDRIEAYHLKNCRWLPWQPTDMLPFSMASADLAVVTLEEKASKLSIPSKTFNYLSVGAAILSIAHPDSELSRLVEGNKVGVNFSADQLTQMNEYIDQLIENSKYYNRLQQNAQHTALRYGSENARLFVANQVTTSTP